MNGTMLPQAEPMYEYEHGFGKIETDGFEVFQDNNHGIDNDTSENEYYVCNAHVSPKIDRGGDQQNSATQKQILQSAKRLIQLMKRKLSKLVITRATIYGKERYNLLEYYHMAKVIRALNFLV